MIITPIAQVRDDYNAAYANIQPLFWLVRTHGDPHLSIPAITEQLRIASGRFPVGHIRTMDEVTGRSTARQSFNMLLLTIFGAVALLLAAIGIYGLMPTRSRSAPRNWASAWHLARTAPESADS